MGRPAHTSITAKQARALRRRMTISEARLWKEIRGRSRGARFRRQVPIGYWIADFASLDPRLVIEVDDISHEFRDETMRTDYFILQGFSVLRFSNRQVALELPEVVGTIEGWLEHIRAFGEAPERIAWRVAGPEVWGEYRRSRGRGTPLRVRRVYRLSISFSTRSS